MRLLLDTDPITAGDMRDAIAEALAENADELHNALDSFQRDLECYRDDIRELTDIIAQLRAALEAGRDAV